MGVGLRLTRSNTAVACHCVLRSIFRECFAKFRQCVEREKSMSHVTMEHWDQGGRRSTWGRKNEEYIADFCLVAKRVLTEDEHRLFRFYYLLGADWRMCAMRLGFDRGTFFNRLYRVQEILGREFREMAPYALYPLDEYFGCTRPRKTVASEPKLELRRALRPPTRRSA